MTGRNSAEAGRDGGLAEGASEHSGRITRRDFAIALGGGVAIAGYYLLRGVLPSAPPPAAAPAPPSPRLRDDVAFGSDPEGMVTLSRTTSAGPVTCAVNATGEEVLAHLDGHQEIDDITRAVALRIGAAPTEALQARVAHFVAQLGALGFLATAFYAYIVEREET